MWQNLFIFIWFFGDTVWINNTTQVFWLAGYLPVLVFADLSKENESDHVSMQWQTNQSVKKEAGWEGKLKIAEEFFCQENLS